MRGRIALAAFGCALGVGFGAAPVAIADSNPTFYVLEAGSSFDYGCYGPCDCAVLTQPLQGRFELKRTAPDPLFENYEVTNIKWQVVGRNTRVDITGAGKYRVGGEFAVQHQLSLDLEVGDHPVQHFDSGLILGGGEFPKIDIEVSIHGQQACFDTVIRVRAVPAVAGVDGGPSVALQRVRPNPFRQGMDIELTLRAAGLVELAIYDPQGRAVRTFGARGLEAGPHSIAWDGRRDDGARSAAGIYFVWLRTAGVSERRAIVKLE